VVPGLEVLARLPVVVTPRPMELFEQETGPRVVGQLLLVEFVQVLALVGVVGDKLSDVAEVELGRTLDAPAVECSADRLVRPEPGDLVAAEAAEPADRLFAQIDQLVVGLEALDEAVHFTERHALPSARRRILPAALGDE